MRELTKLKADIELLVIAQHPAGDGPDVSDYQHVIGMWGPPTEDADLLAPEGASEADIELLAKTRHLRRIRRGERVGLSLPELERQYPEAYNALIDVDFDLAEPAIESPDQLLIDVSEGVRPDVGPADDRPA